MKWFTIILFLFSISCTPTKNIYGEQEIDLKEHYNMHFVDIVINGKRTKLLIDTGASKSLLDISVAEKYKFSYSLLAEDQYVGMGGILDIYAVYDYKMEGPFITFLGADLSDIQYYFNKEGIKIVGVLGADFLEVHNCKIDFKKNILYYNGN